MKAARLPTRLIAFAALAAALPLTGCQQAKEPAAEASTEANPDAKPGLSVSDAVLVLPAVKGNPGAVYFTLANGGKAAATLAAVHIDGAGKAEMHETKGGEMQPLASVPLDPDATVKFAPGGKHVMAFELADTLQPGGTTEMTLIFSDGDKLSAPLKVESAGSATMGNEGGMADMEHMH